MDEGITLKDDQQLIGSGGPFSVDTAYGTQTIPAQTSILPLLTYPVTIGPYAFPAVLLANHNVVSYLRIEHTDGPAILSQDPLQDATLTHLFLIENGLHLSLPTAAIYLGARNASVGGNIIITDNVISDALEGSHHGAVVTILIPESHADLIVQRNTIDADYGCLYIQNTGSSSATSDISSNTLHSARNVQVEIRTEDTAQHTSSLRNNMVTSAHHVQGFLIDAAAGTEQTVTAQNNTFIQGQSGIDLAAAGSALIRGSISGNKFETISSVDFQATTGGADATICLQLIRNDAPDHGFVLHQQASSTINVFPFLGNVGSLVGDHSENPTCP